MHVKFTVLLMPSGAARVTGAEAELPAELFKTEKTVDEEIGAILATSNKKKKKKKKKKKSGAGGED